MTRLIGFDLLPSGRLAHSQMFLYPPLVVLNPVLLSYGVSYILCCAETSHTMQLLSPFSIISSFVEDPILSLHNTSPDTNVLLLDSKRRCFSMQRQWRLMFAYWCSNSLLRLIVSQIRFVCVHIRFWFVHITSHIFLFIIPFVTSSILSYKCFAVLFVLLIKFRAIGDECILFFHIPFFGSHFIPTFCTQ